MYLLLSVGGDLELYEVDKMILDKFDNILTDFF